MISKLTLYFCLIFSTLASTPVLSQSAYIPSASNLEAREWFQDAKFGLFVHWGVYSVMGGGGKRSRLINMKDYPVSSIPLILILQNGCPW